MCKVKKSEHTLCLGYPMLLIVVVVDCSIEDGLEVDSLIL